MESGYEAFPADEEDPKEEEWVPPPAPAVSHIFYNYISFVHWVLYNYIGAPAPKVPKLPFSSVRREVPN